MDYSTLLTKYKKNIAIVSILALITIIVIFINFSFDTTKTASNSNHPVNLSITPRLIPTIEVRQPPRVKFSQWKNTAPPLVGKENVNTYVFKTNFNEEYVTNLAKELQVSGTTQKKDNLILTSTTDSALLFNQKSGSFTYYSKQGILLPAEETTEQSLYKVLQQLGVYDNSMKVTATYKKLNQEGMTYYEIHRDWNAVSLPILNRFGLVSIPETEKLSSISTTPRLNVSKPDNKIISTTDNSDGLSRYNDFNTITIVVYNNRILSIFSNMRVLNNSTLSQVSVKSYDTALQNLQQGQIESIVTAPAGSGFTDWNKVYPDNIAESQEAVVTDSILTLLEDPLNKQQTDLKPFYVFRGYAITKTGFRINFIASVEAVQKNNTLQNVFKNLIRPVFAIDEYQIGSQHQGTFELTVSPTTSPAPTIVSTIAPNQPPSDVCAPTLEQIQPLQDWEGVMVGYFPGVAYAIPGGYYMAGANFAVETQLQDWINRALERHEDGNFTDKDAGGIRELIDIMRDIFTQPACPVRLTGPSPSLFVYSKLGVRYAITPQFSLTYTDPPIQYNGWIINGNKINNTLRKYIYYEYNPVKFEIPSAGWVIKKSEIQIFAQTLSHKLALTHEESDRLYHEIANAAITINAQHIYVGVINEAEIDSQLPLKISPSTIHIRRIHFYITSRIPSEFSSPELKSIERAGEMAVEIGAAGYP